MRVVERRQAGASKGSTSQSGGGGGARGGGRWGAAHGSCRACQRVQDSLDLACSTYVCNVMLLTKIHTGKGLLMACRLPGLGSRLRVPGACEADGGRRSSVST